MDHNKRGSSKCPNQLTGGGVKCPRLIIKGSHNLWRSKTVVISRGLKGWNPLVEISAQPPKAHALAWLFRVYWSCFQNAMMNCALLYGY